MMMVVSRMMVRMDGGDDSQHHQPPLSFFFFRLLKNLLIIVRPPRLVQKGMTLSMSQWYKKKMGQWQQDRNDHDDDNYLPLCLKSIEWSCLLEALLLPLPKQSIEDNSDQAAVLKHLIRSHE